MGIQKKKGEIDMTWMEINAWMERYAGVSYDVSSLVEECRGDVALHDPYVWYTDMNEIIMYYNSIMDLIKEHEHQIPDIFNNSAEFIDMITEFVVEGLSHAVNDARNLLNIQNTTLSTMDDIEEAVIVIYKILDIVTSNDDEQFNEEFDKLNKQYSGRITGFFGVHESQLLTMARKIESIVENE